MKYKTYQQFKEVVENTIFITLDQLTKEFDECDSDVLREVATNPFSTKGCKERPPLTKTLIQVSAEIILSSRIGK